MYFACCTVCCTVGQESCALHGTLSITVGLRLLTCASQTAFLYRHFEKMKGKGKRSITVKWICFPNPHDRLPSQVLFGFPSSTLIIPSNAVQFKRNFGSITAIPLRLHRPPGTCLDHNRGGHGCLCIMPAAKERTIPSSVLWMRVGNTHQVNTSFFHTCKPVA